MPLSCNLGTLTSWNPLGHSRHVTGLLYLLSLLIFTNREEPTRYANHSSIAFCLLYQYEVLIQKRLLDGGYVDTSTFNLKILAFWTARFVAWSLRANVEEKPAASIFTYKYSTLNNRLYGNCRVPRNLDPYLRNSTASRF
jgi:hypothetical protein